MILKSKTAFPYSTTFYKVNDVSEAPLRFVTNTSFGIRLIKEGSVIIFYNQISKDTDLYNLYNTNIHEKITEHKTKKNLLD